MDKNTLGRISDSRVRSSLPRPLNSYQPISREPDRAQKPTVETQSSLHSEPVAVRTTFLRESHNRSLKLDRRISINYVWGYIAVCVFNVLIACVAYIWLPAYRPYLLREDSLVENLSALFFLAACLLALISLVRLKGRKKLLLFVAALGAIGFLDELSFGERIFSLSMPYIGGVKIDAVHDFFFLAYEYKAYAYPLVGIGAIISLIRFWPKVVSLCVKVLMQHPTKLLVSHYVLLFFFAALIFFASVIDLDLIDYEPLSMLEEVLEMNAGLSLVFCCLSLLDLSPRQTRHACR